jgi:hypothetical protein
MTAQDGLSGKYFREKAALRRFLFAARASGNCFNNKLGTGTQKDDNRVQVILIEDVAGGDFQSGGGGKWIDGFHERLFGLGAAR